MQKINIPIKGMHCKSCEMLIEDSLKQVEGVTKCEVSHKEGGAFVYCDAEKPDMSKIEKAIKDAGYEIGTEKENKGFASRNAGDYKDLAFAILLAAGAYFILKATGIFSISVAANSDASSLPVVLLVGLTAGISTCMALVGGLVLGISARHSEKHPEAASLEKFRPHLFFNLGRIIGFGILGGILGIIGSVFEISTVFTGVLVVIVGVVMLFLGFQLIEIFPWLNNFKITLPKGISRILGINKNDKEYSHSGSFVLGALTFFLPCGFTQAMQVFALSSGDFISGALIMSVFALGTMPGLLGIGGITSLIKGTFAKKFYKFTGVVVIFLALFNISSGFKLTGYEIDLSSGNNSIETGQSSDPNVKIENGVQIVSMTEEADGYYPNKFTIKKDMPVKWVIQGNAPYSCASALVVPKLKIRKFLKAGENIVEFTPTEAGKLAFSCSMGMYTGSFNVVDSKDSASSGTVNTAIASEEEEDAPAHACGAAGAAVSAHQCGGSCGGGCGCGTINN